MNWMPYSCFSHPFAHYIGITGCSCCIRTGWQRHARCDDAFAETQRGSVCRVLFCACMLFDAYKNIPLCACPLFMTISVATLLSWLVGTKPGAARALIHVDLAAWRAMSLSFDPTENPRCFLGGMLTV